METEGNLVERSNVRVGFGQSTPGVENHVTQSPQIVCEGCKETFSTIVNLKRHIHRKHNSDENLLNHAKSLLSQISSKPKFRRKSVMCEVCKGCYTTLSGLRRHVQVQHGSNTKLINKLISGNGICFDCNLKFRQVAHLRQHLIEKHDFPGEEKSFTFLNQEDFEDWKSNMEKETSSAYRKSTNESSDNGLTVYYVCNRTGIYKPRFKVGARIKKEKAGGSLKTNHLCTSVIRYSRNGEGVIDVKYFPTHYGHGIRNIAKPTKPKQKPIIQSEKNDDSIEKNDDNVEKSDDVLVDSEAIDFDSIMDITEDQVATNNNLVANSLATDTDALKREIISNLWEVSCNVVACNSMQSLLELQHCSKVIRERFVENA